MVWGNNFNLFQGMLTVGYADGTTYYILHRLLLLLQCTFRVHTGRLGFLDRSTWFDPLLAPMVQNADWPTELPPAGGFGRFGCHPSVTRNACFAKPSGLDRTGSPEAWLEMATESTVTNLKTWEDLFFFVSSSRFRFCIFYLHWPNQDAYNVCSWAPQTTRLQCQGALPLFGFCDAVKVTMVMSQLMLNWCQTDSSI